MAAVYLHPARIAGRVYLAPRTAPLGANAPGAILAGAATLSVGGVAIAPAPGANAPGANLSGSGVLTPGAGVAVAPLGVNAPGAILAGAGTLSAGASTGAPLPVNPQFVCPTRSALGGAIWDFPDVFAGDSETLTFDFRESLPEGESITGVVPRISAHVGVDPDPAALVVAGPSISGSVVSMRIAPTLAGVSYWPRVSATFSDGQRVTLPDPGVGSLRVVS